MTMNQVRETEKACQEVIAKNELVYAKDTKLAVAKSINGLRAVFDETYPDPVRVVSIGIPVEDLVADPNGPGGMNTSVELCGGTHLIRSGHIGDFVISSEEAIAKGIIRIIAVTGPEASKVLKKAVLFEKQVESLETIIKNSNDQKEVKKIVELIEEISQSNISYWKKDELRNRLNNLKKQLDSVDRASKAAVLNEVIEAAKIIAEQNVGNKFVVQRLNAGSNSKALDAAIKQVKTITPNTAVMFFSADQTTQKVICLSSVPKDLVKEGLKANEWVQQIIKTIDGKGGGKDEASQASGSNVNAINNAISLAEEFAKFKLNS
mgnify:CR=1 FL=1